MHCTNCGKEIENNAVACIHCGVAIGTERKFCANCGQAVNANQVICTSCGCALKAGGAVQSSGQKTILPSGKSASTATILSCLITGVGQMYLGQVAKGVAILLGGMVVSGVTCGFAAPVIWVVAMIDAYKIGKKLEAGQPVGEWEFF